MKRIGHLIEQIAEPENLRLAFWKAARGNWHKAEVRRFAQQLEPELRMLREGLLDGDYPVGRFHKFVIRDPKERIIYAPAFPERVLHHALINICEPVFERLAIDDSYACRQGKGQWAALARAEVFARRHLFFLKMDIRKYFDSVSHDRLLELLQDRFKDRRLLDWFGRLLACYETAPGRGLPIGSLTSQHLANFYLLPLDRFVKEALRCRGYVRYMDDFALWGKDSRQLRSAQAEIETFLHERLSLKPKDFPYINRCRHGMDFLGCRVFPGYSVLNRRSRRRFASKLRRYEYNYESGAWDEATLQRHALALLGFAAKPCSWSFRRQVLRNLGQRLIGLQPRESRGQLEQRRQQLHVLQPEQQHSVQPEQQPRIPCCPSSDQGRMAQGTEPAVVLSTNGCEGIHAWRNAKPGRPVSVGGSSQAENSGRPD